MMAMAYTNVYVARVALGANDAQTVKAVLEAEAFKGPSIIIAYSHCINHGYNLVNGLNQQKAAVQSGYWPLLRYNPDLANRARTPWFSTPRRLRFRLSSTFTMKPATACSPRPIRSMRSSC